jgi:hypothetical protein
LTHTVPTRSAAETRRARRMSFVHTPAAKPYFTSLAIPTASCSSSNGAEDFLLAHPRAVVNGNPCWHMPICAMAACPNSECVSCSQAVRISRSISVTALSGVSLACAAVHLSVGVQEPVPGPIGHRVVHPQATLYRSERYRSADADYRRVLAVGASAPVDRAQPRRQRSSRSARPGRSAARSRPPRTRRSARYPHLPTPACCFLELL